MAVPNNLTPEEHARIADFLKEYKELSIKYGIRIGSCGCCGSPWLQLREDKEETLEEHINWLANEILK